jgi:hypothetical protein
MRATKIRLKDGSKPSQWTLEQVQSIIDAKMGKMGFITEVYILNSTSIKVGLHMCSFRINTNMRGYNADTGHSGKRCKAGYKKTSIPTWEERVMFNDIVNDAFDTMGLNCNIKSGSFIVRDFDTGRYNERDWDLNRHSNERAYYEISKESELLNEAVAS